MKFQFNSVNGDIKNILVAGPDNRRYFAVVTNPSSPGFTVIQNSDGVDIAAIGWTTHAFIEIPGIVTRQTTRHWIGLAASLKYVVNAVVGSRY
jgi:hypothetical protein